MKSVFFLILAILSVGFNAQMLSSVYFEHNSYELNEGSKKKLDSLALLKAGLTFRIFGNCDSSGETEYNRLLSEKRANAVSAYLQGKIGNNIRLENTTGLGEEKQINDNSTDELRGKNRRVDIFIEKIFAPGEIISRKALPSFLSTKVSQMKVKDTFSLPDVNFIGGRHVWLPNGSTKLDQLLRILKDHPALEVELQGHICCDYENFDGEDIDLGTFNLSWTRANAIKEFLQKEGIASDRIKVKGLGHLNPVAYPERTETDRIRNRRVELVLLKK
ncbi:outer membrane protein OmpA-like peptidoglycan-associated protein [Chryseobacterium defluvii]|uniref:Outer membrane protein OmpA-like peptidoglycan-associated protein n=1 Tax=Chryseobacterium defluvii TaxID=160396 RepID=A0A840KAR9_9FLAO|nr:OmpA family protein [Chryseobacterium defluvii]MBB4805097.1 outer membrane protein OmpA-like peptidoglycan-associated protein [Chryseobacterium defluvii]